MGVIVLQGEAQAALIESRLLEFLGTDEIGRRRLICGNPYSFQGDERDVMLLSMVAAPDIYGQFKEGPTDEKRYNVAMSRARDQVWLFHSVKLNDLSGAYLRKGLLDFFENTKPQPIVGFERDELERRATQDNRGIVKPPRPFDSWFEVDVAMELVRKGFSVNPQFEFAGKWIDLVVEGGQARLAVECDGDQWHGVDHYEQDMQRQRQLERCDWEFFRVRESAFYSNREQALKGLWRVLEERGIYPRTMAKNPEKQTAETNEPATESMTNDKTAREVKSIHGDTGVGLSIKVRIGSTVVYIDEDDKRECQALITNNRSNPDWGTINANTPIAKALIGATVGQVVVAHLPLGPVRLRVIEIS